MKLAHVLLLTVLFYTGAASALVQKMEANNEYRSDNWPPSNFSFVTFANTFYENEELRLTLVKTNNEVHMVNDGALQIVAFSKKIAAALFELPKEISIGLKEKMVGSWNLTGTPKDIAVDNIWFDEGKGILVVKKTERILAVIDKDVVASNKDSNKFETVCKFYDLKFILRESVKDEQEQNFSNLKLLILSGSDVPELKLPFKCD